MSDLEAAEREIDRLAAQRDALLEALRAVVQESGHGGPHTDYVTARTMRIVADAIALAEGGAL